jgi:hypothetical protein
MNAPPFPTNPSFNQQFGNWVWSGSRWVCTNTNGVRVNTQVFLTSAPYMPSPGLISCIVDCIGGGGGGGGVWAIAGVVGGGGGGGSGGYSRITLASGLVLGGVNVIIGAAGTPVGQAGGTSGGTTSFGAFCVANGGGGGADYNGSTVWGAGGVGAPAGVGEVIWTGVAGMTALTSSSQAGGTTFTQAIGGMGGALIGGHPAPSVGPVGPGQYTGGPNAQGFSGAGGGGAAAHADLSAAVLGGYGAPGICIVTEYCWADTVDDGCGCGPTGQARVAIGGPQSWGFDGND